MGARFYQCVLNLRNDNTEEFESHKARFIKFEEKLPDRVRGIAFQEERGEEGTRHLQIHVELTTTLRVNGVKRELGCEYLHVERARSRAASRTYCTKADTRIDGPWEFGDLGNRQGNRTDLQAFQEAIDAGTEDRDLWQEHFATMLRHHRAVGVYRLARRPATRAEPRVRVYYGPPGTGKSHRALQEAQEYGTPYFPDLTGQISRWDGYDGVSPVVIDDFVDQVNIHFMKRVLDKYPLQVPIMGGFIPFSPSYIFITSNHHPANWWDGNRNVKNVDRAAIIRRLHAIESMDTVYAPTE